MITICITNNNIGNKEWRETKHGWSLNEDYVNGIDSKFLNRTMICDNDGMVFIVCEKAVPLPLMNLRDLPGYISDFANVLEGDGVLIHLAKSGRLTAIRTAHATVPIYVSGETNQFCADWDFNSIASQRQLVTLSRTELRRFIQYGPELSQATIAQDIKQLLPGQKAIWSPGGAQIEISDGIVESINSMPNDKPDLIITGIGGDELAITSDYDDQTTPCGPKITQSLFFGDPTPTHSIPKTFVSQSALAAAFVRARMFLHHDIWPKNPFIDPRVVQFCQMVPPEHKKNRLLNKLTLARAGLSDYFITPRFKENFSRVFMDDLLDFRSDAYFSESLLHSHMIANAAVLANEIRTIQNGANADLSLYVIINAVRLEHILRNYSEKFSIRFCD